MPNGRPLKTIISNSVWTFAMMLVSSVSGFVISLVTARILGPQGKGDYAFVMLVVTTTAFLANPSLYTAANYFISSKKAEPKRIFASILALSAVSSLLAFVFAFLVLQYPISDQPDISANGKYLIALGAAACCVSITMNGTLYGLKRIRLVTTWTMLSALLQALLVVIISVLFPGSLAAFIEIFVLFHVLDAIAKTYFSGRGYWRKLSLRLAYLQPLLRFGLSVYLGRVLLLFSQRLDNYILYGFRGAESLGYYSISISFAEQLWTLPIAINFVVLTNISALPDTDKKETTVHISQIITLAELLGAMLLGISSIFLIPILFGEIYRPSVVPLLLVLPGVVAFSSYYAIEPFFQSITKPKIPTWIAFWGALSNLVLSIIMIYYWGINGAALAYSISYLIQLGLTLVIFAKITAGRFWAPIDVFSLLKAGFAYGKIRLARNVQVN
jgi:O-antigen/teichoic acid export membrane protein